MHIFYSYRLMHWVKKKKKIKNYEINIIVLLWFMHIILYTYFYSNKIMNWVKKKEENKE